MTSTIEESKNFSIKTILRRYSLGTRTSLGGYLREFSEPDDVSIKFRVRGVPRPEDGYSSREGE